MTRYLGDVVVGLAVGIAVGATLGVALEGRDVVGVTLCKESEWMILGD